MQWYNQSDPLGLGDRELKGTETSLPTLWPGHFEVEIPFWHHKNYFLGAEVGSALLPLLNVVSSFSTEIPRPLRAHPCQAAALPRAAPGPLAHITRSVFSEAASFF